MVIPFPLGDDVKQRGTPWAVIALILVCVTLFVLARYFSEPLAAWLTTNGALVPSDFKAAWTGVLASPGSVFTSPLIFFRRAILPAFGHMFLHANEVHLLGNMIFLWFFGRSLQSRIGLVRFLIFFFLCGILAMVVHIVLEPEQTIPMVGASGAIAGVLGGYLPIYPRARIRLGIWMIVLFKAEMPAILFMAVWFLYQLANAQDYKVSLNGCQSIAYFAHIGGFLAGLATIAFFLWQPTGKKGKKNKKKR